MTDGSFLRRGDGIFFLFLFFQSFSAFESMGSAFSRGGGFENQKNADIFAVCGSGSWDDDDEAC